MKVGDRVILSPNMDNPMMSRQQKRHPGPGYIQEFFTNTGAKEMYGIGPDNWCWVQFDDGYRNCYPSQWVLPESNHMSEPDQSLEEIELAQEVYREVKHRR